MQIIKLKFRQASDHEFFVTLSCSDQPWEVEGYLSLIPEALSLSIRQWQTTYRQLEEVRSIAFQPNLRIIPKSVQVNSSTQCINEVKTQLNVWLNNVDGKWQPIREGLISFANQFETEELQIIINAQNIDLCRLPWQEWNLLRQYYPQAEVAISTPTAKDLAVVSLKTPLVKSKQPRILLVVGKSNGINTESDLQVIHQLLGNKAEIIYLLQPSLKDLAAALWCDRGYHIFIFTGHSGSNEDGTIGWIEVNDSERLGIDEFKDSFQQAINQGLQLAIFNSCDGLGLADRLIELNLGQIIVMSEPVPDEIAIEFLEHFLREFIDHKSLFSSIHTARKKLEHFNTRYPGAVWLPTLCLKQVSNYVNWQSMTGNTATQKVLANKSTIEHVSKPNLVARVTKILRTVATWLLVLILGLSLNIIFPQLDIQILPQSIAAFISSYGNAELHLKFPQGRWQYSGSQTWRSINNLVVEQISQPSNQFRLIYTHHPTLPNGSSTGIKMLIDGQVSFSLSSRPVSDLEYDAAIIRGKILKQVPVAIDRLAVVVNPNLNIDGLTVSQLAGIYSGRITNWSQIGGQDLLINPYAHSTQSGTTEFFRNNILKSRTYGGNVVFLEESELAIQKIQAPIEPGGIYFVSASEVINNCKLKLVPIARRSGHTFVDLYQPADTCDRLSSNIPNNSLLNLETLQIVEYPLIRRLFIIIEINSPIDEEVGEAYKNLLLSKQGQKIVEHAGFIPIRSFS